MQFIESALRSKHSDCIPWPFSKGKDGRGIIPFRGKGMTAGRVVCILHRGKPPTPAHQAAHSCHNGHLGCIQPRHLDWKTPLENTQETTRQQGAQFGERNNGAKLTVRRVIAIRKSKETPQVLAKRYGVTPQTVRSVRKRLIWREVGIA